MIFVRQSIEYKELLDKDSVFASSCACFICASGYQNQVEHNTPNAEEDAENTDIQNPISSIFQNCRRKKKFPKLENNVSTSNGWKWATMHGLFYLFAASDKATAFFGGEKYPTSVSVWPCLRTIKLHLADDRKFDSREVQIQISKSTWRISFLWICDGKIRGLSKEDGLKVFSKDSVEWIGTIVDIIVWSSIFTGTHLTEEDKLWY